jgi:hypothetical protein
VQDLQSFHCLKFIASVVLEERRKQTKTPAQAKARGDSFMVLMAVLKKDVELGGKGCAQCSYFYCLFHCRFYSVVSVVIFS